MFFGLCTSLCTLLWNKLSDPYTFLGFSIFGLLTSFVYLTLPEDRTHNAEVAERLSAKPSLSDDDEEEEGFTLTGCFYNICLLLTVLSFAGIIILTALYFFYGDADWLFNARVICSCVFVFSLVVSVMWPAYKSGGGITPWWWGL